MANKAGPSQPKKKKYQKLTESLLLSPVCTLEEGDFEDDYQVDEEDDSFGDSSDFEQGDIQDDWRRGDTADIDHIENIEERVTVLNTKVIDWKSVPSGMKHFPFAKSENLLIQPKENSPLGYFRLLLTDEFLTKVVEETNRNATDIYLSPGTTEQSRICFWKDMTISEMLVFLGVFLHMNNVKINRIQDYWKKDPLFHIKGIADSISRNRFILILRALHFSNHPRPEESKPKDMLYKIRPIIDFFNNRMCQIYYPGRELLVNELICWRGQLHFCQYSKNKKHTYGLKLYILSDTTGIVQKFAVYEGILDDLEGKEDTRRVVLHLLSEKLDVGHHIYMDSYYNSFDLAVLLLDRKTHCTGTLRMGRNSNPKDIEKVKLKKGEAIANYAEGVMIGKWREERDVCYISTIYKNEMVELQNKRNETISKPLPIIKYNKYMSRVDRQDQVSDYLSERKTLHWYKKLFMHVVEMMLINAHALFIKYSGKKMLLYEFRLNVIRSLLPSIDAHQPSARNLGHLVVKRTLEAGRTKIQRKKCRLCAVQGKRTDTIYECPDCPERAGYCLNCCYIHHK